MFTILLVLDFCMNENTIIDDIYVGVEYDKSLNFCLILGVAWQSCSLVFKYALDGFSVKSRTSVCVDWSQANEGFRAISSLSIEVSVCSILEISKKEASINLN